MFSIGPPPPDVSTWEGRMSFRASVRRSIANLTDPPPEPDEADHPPRYMFVAGWECADGCSCKAAQGHVAHFRD